MLKEKKTFFFVIILFLFFLAPKGAYEVQMLSLCVSVPETDIFCDNVFVFKAREPVDLVLILNVHDHGPVHVPHVDPLELRVAIGQEPDVVSDHMKCKYNARSHDFSVRGAVRYKSLL